MSVTKFADELLSDTEKDYLATAGRSIEGLTGAMLLGNAYLGGHLTGRESLYHGTSAESKKGILEKGILPTTKENSVFTDLITKGTEANKKAFGKSYLARNPWEAVVYGLNATGASGENSTLSDRIYSALKNKGKIGIVRANAPTWKMNIVPDPMYDMPFDQFMEDRRKNLKARNLQSFSEFLKINDPKTIGQKLWNKALNALDEFKYKTVHDTGGKYVVVDGTTPTQYIRGSKDYQGLTFNEFKDYVINNKLRFAGGIAKTLVGAGMLGHAIYSAVNKYKENKKREEQNVYKDDRNIARELADNVLGPISLNDEERDALIKHYGLKDDANLFLRHIGRTTAAGLGGELGGALGSYGVYRALSKTMPTTARLSMLPVYYGSRYILGGLGAQKYSKDNALRILNENAAKNGG